MINILERINEYRQKRHWNEHQLAEKSGLPQSTISSWYRNNMQPTFSSLEKICNAFEIPMSQFLADNQDLILLTPDQRELLVEWNRMNKVQQERLLNFIKAL